MNRTVTVKVTARDIARGERMKECRCPVALALNRALRCRGATVDGGRLRASKGGRGILDRPFTRDVTKFVGAFDNKEPVAPFAFTVVLS